MPGEIGRFIYTILSADATLQSALGVSSSTAANKKVYPNFAPQNETAPYIVYERSDTQPIHCKEGLPIVDHYYVVSCFAENPDTLETIAERVIFLFNNATGTYGTTVITGCLYDSDRDETYDLEPILFSRDIEFQIREKR